MSDGGGSVPPRWQLVRERRRRDVADVDDDGDIDVLDEVAGPLEALEALEAQGGTAIAAIVRRVAARGCDEEVRFERDDLLDLQDAMPETGDAGGLPGMVARALAMHAELVWTTRSVPANFARHVRASGGVVFAVMADDVEFHGNDLREHPDDIETDADPCAGDEDAPDDSEPDVADDDRLAAVMNRRLAGAGFALAPTRDIVDAAGLATGWSWRTDGAEQYARRPWHVARSPCRFVGTCRGYLRVQACWPRTRACDDLWRALAIAAGGVVARLDDDRARSTVALVRRSLAEAVDGHGLDDGDALLTREPGPYLDDVVARVADALAVAGLAAVVHVVAGRHDPIAASIGAASLAGLEVELWLRELSVVEPPCFGALVAPPR